MKGNSFERKVLGKVGRGGQKGNKQNATIEVGVS
jgi:hypothetical protein